MYPGQYLLSDDESFKTSFDTTGNVKNFHVTSGKLLFQTSYVGRWMGDE